MATQPLESREENLEKRVTQLEQLPARIDGLESQIQQLRTEMHAEFSAVRGDLAGKIAEQGQALRVEMAEQGQSLRAEMAEQGTALGTQMRVLHEDVIGRIALLQEGLPTRSRRPRKK